MKMLKRNHRSALVILISLASGTASYTQHPLLGTTDIPAYLEAIPRLPDNLAEAVNRAYGDNPSEENLQRLDEFYRPYETRAEERIQEYQAFAQQKMLAQGVQNSEAAYLEQSLQDVNANPIIANMGGMEKISQMSEEEKQAAALKAVSQFTANPSGSSSAGMTALYQRVVTDPEYAQKFQNMSEAQKEAELRKYMAEDKSAAASPTPTNRPMQEADRIRNAQTVQLKLMELYQKLSEVTTNYGSQINAIEQNGRNHEAISEEVDTRYQAIPLVELGEYGRDHDPDQVKALLLEAATLHRDRAARELSAYSDCWHKLREDYKTIVQEYLAFITEHPQLIYGGLSPADIMHGLNTENPLLEFEAAMIGLSIELCRQAKELIKKSVVWENN